MFEEEIFTSLPFLPPIKEYMNYLQKAYNQKTLTNHGILLQELEEKLADYLKVDAIQCVTSATTGLQMAIQALEIEPGSEIITTPFSYVATTTAILSEKCTPVYVDIEPDNLTIDTEKIEEKITPKTKAIMPVHIFGYACNIEKINQIAKQYDLKVIYDAAHAFGAEYNNKPIIEYGDISVISMQESKLFHTVEGGIIYSKNPEIMEKINLIKQCGHIDDNYICNGINARLSELHAAMGLANINYIDEVINKRRQISELYDKMLSGYVTTLYKQPEVSYKYPYYVIILNSVKDRFKVNLNLCRNKIYPWHCYYPTLNKLKYLKKYQPCPVAEDICARVLQMPFYYELEEEDIKRICEITIQALESSD